MWEATVVRTSPFLETIRRLSKGETDWLLSSCLLRQEYADDPHSQVEIDRWVARALSKAGRYEEALALMHEIKSRMEEYQFDLGLYHFEVIELLQRVSSSDLVQAYCRGVKGHFRTCDALGHLDWLLQYASSTEAACPTDFMFTVLALSAIQLGLPIPPRNIAGRDFCTLVERCIELRDA